MKMHLVKVKTLHRYTISQLNEIINTSKSKYSRAFLRAILMRYNGIHTLCRTRVSITTCIKSEVNVEQIQL